MKIILLKNQKRGIEKIYKKNVLYKTFTKNT